MNQRLTITICYLVCAVVMVDAADYLRDIKPVLKARCYACHGALKQKAGLRVDTAANIRKGAKSDSIVIPGDPERSGLLIRVISDDKDERMPPEGAPLKAHEIAAIREWITAGLPLPENEKAEIDPKKHWAFQNPKKASLPENSPNPIDVILERRRVALNLKAQPEADRTILLRRLYLNLIGLPPTMEQLADKRPWEEIVDELLKNPQHGERWARHWMDIWRYTDWYGLGKQLRNSQKHIWHWRDWIVESLNSDKGYDRMVQEMLAADELAPEDPEALRATGFLARNYYLFNRTTWLDSTIEHTAKAFFGLTVNCAKCHDHKYDPITQEDYYRFRAIFEPHQVRLDPLPGVMDFEKNGLPRVFDDHLDIKTYLHLRGDPKNPDKTRVLDPGVPAVLAKFAPKIEPVRLPVYAYAPAVRDHVQADHLSAAKARVDIAKKDLVEAQKKVANARKSKPEIEPEPIKAVTKLNITDDFSKHNKELWKVVGKGWQFKDGAARQTISSRGTERLVLRPRLPRDFELTCRYTHTGGNAYRSVTFRFDVSSDLKYANYVYTSAHAPGPKLHVAYTRDGTNTYPPEARVAQPIQIGKPYTIRLAVRDRLVNIWLNDKFQIAYSLPDRGPSGQLSLSGFDATVAFDDIRIRSLPTDVKLVESKNNVPVLRPVSSVEISQSKLAAAQSSLVALQAIFAAEKKRGNEAAFTAASHSAAMREAEALKVEGEHELKAFAKDGKKVSAAQRKIANAKKKLTALAGGLGSYTPLRVTKKALESPAHKEDQYPAIYPDTSTGRRSALAQWVTNPKNPLTARVAVNHVWLRHFGEPLVETVDDFGLRAKNPLHRELLDHLAVVFMESGWSFHHLHRLIVTSQAYRLGSSSKDADFSTQSIDPDNHYYWRMNTRRMESQVVRDSLLHLAGVLDFSMGGASVVPGDSVRRRSLYFKHSRDQQDNLLKKFNDADHLQCYRRTESIVPQQALALYNSKLSVEMAGLIASRFEESNFIQNVFQFILGRLPDEGEMKACRQTLSELESVARSVQKTKASERARRGLVHALLNHNDFISIR